MNKSSVRSSSDPALLDRLLSHPGTVTGQIQRRLAQGEHLPSDVVIDEYGCTRPLFFAAIRVFESDAVRALGYRLHGRGTKGDEYRVSCSPIFTIDFSQRSLVEGTYSGLVETQQRREKICAEIAAITARLTELGDELRLLDTTDGPALEWLATQANGGQPIEPNN